MQELDRTVRTHIGTAPKQGQVVTVFDASHAPYTVSLDDFGKDTVTLGRESDNDIVLFSRLVSRHHGRFVKSDGKWTLEDAGSTNGFICNNVNIVSRELADGDFIRIDDGVETVAEGVLLVFTASESQSKWSHLMTGAGGEITVGRDARCTVVLGHVSVSKLHARIVRDGDAWYLSDAGSTNGVLLNGVTVTGKCALHEKDVIVIANAKLIFTKTVIFYCCYTSGISVDASDIVIRRGRDKKSFVTCNHVSVGIRPGELVAIVGGSGAGKSTLLGCMCGSLPPKSGSVYINGVDLYRGFEQLKKTIGYVPQSDIVYDNLTLYDMLSYTAKLRLPADTTPAEREAAIDRAIASVELGEKKNAFIKALSGGQKKRASIAVELLSDPNLLYLDEPASGLDPSTERNLMHSLREMASSGKTVVLVTHSTLQLKLCDRIIFMGKGGRLCFFGSYDDALEFFGVDDIVDIYAKLSDSSREWSEKYARIAGAASVSQRNDSQKEAKSKQKSELPRQLGVLCSRYMRLVFNDRQRLILLILQAPLLAALISFVADGEQFEQYEMTKSLLFALSCSAFWIGMLNSIQEICKERSITRREYMTGLSLTSYVISKIAVLGVLCLVQSLLLTGVFSLLVGVPYYGVFLPPFIEMLITAFTTSLASAAIGLFVSSLFTNADRAMTVAPILLLPQILFSGLIFKLEGSTQLISWLTVCRFSMEGFGTVADLNELDLMLEQKGLPISHAYESFFDFSVPHLLGAWAILLAFTAVSLTLARLMLSRINKD